jgi:hypothetical protein
MSRVPGVIRPDTGFEQRLIFTGNRITVRKLFDFLDRHPDYRPKIDGGGSMIKSQNLVSTAWAVDYCNKKWPLESSNKQSALMCWAIYLAGNTDISRDEAIEFLAENDQGFNPIHSEYVRAVDRGFAKFGL